MYHGIGADKESTFTDPGLGVNPYAGVFGYANVVITENTFGVYWEPIHLNGALVDSIITRNTFWPGASVATLALGVAGSRHLDISANTVDGTQTTYSQGLVGWRAGFFFAHMTSHEQLLVASNTFSCVGTRHGQDGEAISTDANRDHLGFRSGQLVTAVLPSGDSVMVTPGPGEALLSVDQGKYLGRWLRVHAGPGRGQARKIIGALKVGDNIQFAVSPPFDVLPVVQQSRILVSQQSWQLYIVDNVINNDTLIDNTHTHACAALLARAWTDTDYAYTGDQLKDLHYASIGLIGTYVSTVDSAIEANRLTNTAGISVDATYFTDNSAGNGAGCAQGGATVLASNVPVINLSGSQALYCLEAVSTDHVTFTVTGLPGSGNVDLYVRAGSPPTLEAYDCRSNSPGFNETCAFTSQGSKPLDGPYYVWLVGTYTGVTLTGNAHRPSAQRTAYFVEVRRNVIEGAFGFQGKPRPENFNGSGIILRNQVGTLIGDKSPPPPTPTLPDVMGFGVSIARNTLHHAALANLSGGSNGVSYPAAVAVGMDGNWAAEAQTPGYVDTLIFGNTISAVLPAVPAPVSGNPQAFGILNGEGSPNYPRGTLVCDNQVTEVTQDCRDVPPPGPPGQWCATPSATPIVCP
jgi:hypothetical protein